VRAWSGGKDVLKNECNFNGVAPGVKLDNNVTALAVFGKRGEVIGEVERKLSVLLAAVVLLRCMDCATGFRARELASDSRSFATVEPADKCHSE
jgi:hypothetical protein